MNLFEPKILGMIMLILLGLLIVIKRAATGSMIDLPKGSRPVRLINTFNLFFLLVVIPGTSLLLMTGHPEVIDPTRIVLLDPWVQPVWNLAGLMAYSLGHFLMGWSLLCLGRNFQTGGMPPRIDDKIIMKGPYRIVRHPVYTGALCIALGLAVLTQSGALFGVFGAYFVLIMIMTGIEEEHLLRIYSEQYPAYRLSVKKLIPFIY